MTTHTQAVAEFSILLARAMPDASAYTVGQLASRLTRGAASLHRRYEAACSYEWACTEAYERATERKEAALGKLATEHGLGLAYQRDPRGAPLVVCRADGSEIHIPYL